MKMTQLLPLKVRVSTARVLALLLSKLVGILVETRARLFNTNDIVS